MRCLKVDAAGRIDNTKPIYLFSRTDKHLFRTNPSIKSVWEIAHSATTGIDHCSKFPLELARRCIESYGSLNKSTLVLDPFAGSWNDRNCCSRPRLRVRRV